MKQRGHYGLDIRAELEKCKGPLRMACPSCRVDYSANDVRSMCGIERTTKFGLPNLKGKK